MEYGLWNTDYGIRKTENGKQKTENGKRKTETETEGGDQVAPRLLYMYIYVR